MVFESFLMLWVWGLLVKRKLKLHLPSFLTAITWTSCLHSLKDVRNKSFNLVCCSGVSERDWEKIFPRPKWQDSLVKHKPQRQVWSCPALPPSSGSPLPACPDDSPCPLSQHTGPTALQQHSPSPTLAFEWHCKAPMGSHTCRKHTGLGGTSWVTKSVSMLPVSPLCTTPFTWYWLKDVIFCLSHTHWKPGLKTLLQLWAFPWCQDWLYSWPIHTYLFILAYE